MPRPTTRPFASRRKTDGSLRAKYAVASLALLALVAVVLFSVGFRSASAQVALGEPQLLPGDLGSVAAAGAQERPQLSRGADSYLSVWTDSRTVLSGTLGTSGTGLGSLQDIYAARIGADGQVIDTTPIIVSQEQNEQTNPRVGWNGQNWLVSWLTKRPRNEFSHTLDLVAARVSPAGVVLDAAPIVIRADVSIDSKPAAVIEDGTGNWLVTFESFLPQEGVNIPRGVLAARISNDGVVLDPGGRLIYNHHSQFMGDSDIARAGDRYLLTYVDVNVSSHAVMGLLLDASLNPLRNGAEQLGNGGTKPRVASNGETWFVINRATGTLVNRNGDVDVTTGFINPVSSGEPIVCWDGQLWFVAFSTNYNAATQTYIGQDDLYVSRISATGALLDPSGLPVKQGTDYQLYAAIAPGIGGGVQVAWQDLEKVDISTARVTREGAVGADKALALGAPRQSRVRMATNGNGFLAVFRSEVSNASRILGQHLNADGTPADAEPFVISNEPSSGNPSVGWDGANYLAVWDQTTTAGRQTFGAIVPAVGNTSGAPFFIAQGFLPDAAGLNGTFLVVNILQETSQIKTTQGTLVSGAGAPLGAPFKMQRAFNTWPRVAAFAGRWLAIWEFHGNHDGSPGSIHGSFVEPSGTFSAPFLAGDVSSDVTPHLAVAGDKALVVWSNGDIHARRLNADGSSPDPQSGAPVAAAAGLQSLPAVAWDGDEYVVTWVDQRNELFPQQPRGDIYAARVAPTNVKFEEFPIANSALPEDAPFVISTGGLTLFSYSKFNPQSPYAALRVTTRAARFGAPPGMPPALAPANLSATQVNSGVGTVTLQWTDRTDNEEGFKLELKSDTGAFNQIKLLPANATTTTVTNLSPNQPYVFRLRAYNAAGDSDYSNEGGAPAVVMTRFTTNTYNEPATVQLAATASDPDGVSRVEFLTSTNGTSYSLLATDTDAPYSYQWENVPRGYYYVQARAYDAVGSHTTSLYESFVVYGNPTASISSPSNGATFAVGSPVNINATAQTHNGNGEYLLRMDFYANATLIGTVQGHYASYQFTWANPPTGSYQLTARPTSSMNLTGSSTPVQVTVGAPGANISGRVTDSAAAPLYGVTVALSGAQSAQATTDTDGNYFFTNLAVGSSYTVRPQASGYTFNPSSLSFNNLTASQTANFTGAPNSPVPTDPNAAPIYAQTSDSRAVEGPSSKTITGQQVDQEVADDFDLKAQITRVRVAGSRGGYNAPPNPDYRGIYVRFYDGSTGTPGAQQAEYFLPKGAPGVSFNAAQPNVFDVTLPTPFNASGKHFVSMQPVYEGTETWWPSSGGYPNVRGSAWLKRDRLTNGAWTVGGVAGNLNDMSFDLFGTLQLSPRLDSVSPNPVTRSGLVRITGAYFGATQGASKLTIDGKQSQYIAHWSDNLIVAYVPETSSLGDVAVSVTSAAGVGTASLNVTTRPTEGRIRWRFTVAGDYVLHRSGIGPDGTIYLNDTNGRLYALTPDGALKWVFRAGAVGYVGPVTVGADGTIYVAGLVPRDPATPCQNDQYLNNVDGIFAVNPDGTQKWLFAKTCQGIIAGPNVGPDGKIYAVADSLGIGAFALNPDGSLAYAVDRFGEHGPLGEEIVFGPSAPGLPPTQQYFQFDFGSIFGYTLQGQRVFSYPTVTTGQPVAGLQTGSVYTVGFPIGAGYRLLSLTPQGALRWQSSIQPVSSLSAPDTPPGETSVYVVQDQYKLHRVNPANGSVVWTFIDGEILFDPIASPDDRLALMGGRLAFGQPGFFEAVSKDGNKLWKQFLPDELGLAPYGQVVPISRARFTADGQTAYIAADVAGDNPTASNPVYSFFYALDTSDKELPINQPPKVTVVSPLPNSNVPNRTPLDFKASVQDDGKIDRVEFLYNHNGSQTRIGTDTTPDADGNYGVKFTPPGPGVYGLFAAAYDAGGLRSESQIAAVTVSNQAPTISWVSPANNSTFAAPTSITLTARAADSDGQVSIVHFNSSLLGDLGQDTTADAQGNYQIVWSNPTDGTHELYAWATDNDGTRRAATINITIGPATTPTPTPTPTPTATPTPTPTGASPTISITSPADRASFTPGTTVNVTAAASDSDGRIARVEFWHDGMSGPVSTDLNAPYSAQIRWPSPSALKLYAVAYDDTGNKTQSAPIFIYFEDPAGNLTITGRITHQRSTPANPVYLSNALVKLGFGNYAYRATRTDANGYYTFTGLSYGGRYKIEPSEPGYVFYPPSVSYEGLVESVTRDFVADGALPPGPTPTPTPGASALVWEKFYNSPHNSGDSGALLATDGQGNTYVAGTSYAPAGGDTNISLVKYAPDGTQLWQREHAGRGDYKDWATSVRADSEGNVYVSGTAWGGSAYEYDIVTIKYAADGTELWTSIYNGPLGRWDTSAAMELDNAGNVIVGGYSQTSDTSGRLYDELLVIKYNAVGGVVWERRNSIDRRGDRLVALAVDSSRNVYATGEAWVGHPDGSLLEDIVTVKYGPDGTKLWSSQFNRAASTVPLPQQLPNNPTSRARPGGLSLDPATGDLYVFGSSEFGSTGLDYLLLKYNTATGELRWNRNWAGARSDTARALAVDAQGNAYLTGESYDGDFESATAVRSTDVATVKFAPDGATLWERLYRGFPGKTDAGRRVVVDPAGSAYVAFYSEGFFTSDTGVVKYHADGTEQWVYRYDNPTHTSDQVTDLVLDAAGNLYVTGYASVLNAAGSETTDLVTFKLAPATSSALNIAPEVRADVQGAATTGSPVTVNAIATDLDGTVARVDFYDGTAQIGTDASAPFSVEWSPTATGTHAITALATDNKDASRTSKTHLVTVAGAQQVYVIAGQLTANGSPLAGVSVALGGALSAETKTGADGRYAFTSLTAGGSYTVTPSLTDYTFAPTSRAFSNLSENGIADFTASSVPASIGFGAASYAVGEGSGSAVVNVTRSVNTSTAVSVGYSTGGGTAAAGADYTATSGTLSFAAGEISKTITVPILDDAAVESAETFTLTLSSLAGGAVVGSPSSTTVTIADNDSCSYQLSQTTRNSPAAGDSVTVSVTAPAGCAWTAASNSSFISLNSGAAGNGNGDVTFSVAANNNATQRTGTLTIAGHSFTVTQASVTCAFTLSSVSQSFGATGGAGSVNLTAAAADCVWAAASNAGWITISSSANGVGSGVVNFSVAVNPGSTPRTATLTIAGQTITVTQAGVACSYAVSQQTPSEFSATGGQGGFQMVAPQGCAWTVSSLVPWITITSGASGTGTGSVTFTVAANTGAARTGQILHTDDSFINVRQAVAPASFRLESSAVSVSEGAQRAELKVVRAGDTSGAASVTLKTVDDPEAVPCAVLNGKAYARCDYATTIETVSWAAGDAQPKTVQIPLIDDARTEGAETVRIRLSDPQGGVIGDSDTATLTITDGAVTEGANPIFTTPFFVRQQYLDFLSREPEADEPWSRVLNNCSDVNNNPFCDRLVVSQSFFGAPEFRLKGLFVYNFYSVALNRRPTYEEIIPDMRSVSGATAQEVYQKRAAFPVAFTGRAEFKTLYDSVSDASFVNTLLDRYGLQQITTPDPANPEGGTKVLLTRADLISRLGTSGAQSLTRAQVLRAVVESNEIGAAEYNRAFVAMQYFGYLRRTPEESGYQAWLRVINADPNNIRIMVNGFMNSAEYRLRFANPTP